MTKRNGKDRIDGGPKKNGSKPKTAGKTAVALVAQAHGGALLVGGVPGNRGGSGRPKDRVRAACLRSFEERIPILEEIADGEPIQKIEIPGKEGVTIVRISASPSERIKAIGELGKMGLSEDRPTLMAAAEFGSGESGMRFTLVLGERQTDAE